MEKDVVPLRAGSLIRVCRGESGGRAHWPRGDDGPLGDETFGTTTGVIAGAESTGGAGIGGDKGVGSGECTIVCRGSPVADEIGKTGVGDRSGESALRRAMPLM